MLAKFQKKDRRATRIRSRIIGTESKPRLSIFRSNSSIYAQAIDDISGKTLCAAHDLSVKKGTKTERAASTGKQIAEAMIAKGIKECVFDRGGNLYHGRIKALADAAREAGLSF
jgi:large subunit ribosomal protein L18